ncbi:trehalose-phosphatase [soil metagenome]
MLSLPPTLPERAALFLDFDGTLVPIAQRPQDVRVPPSLVPTLQRLQVSLDGALAIVSGRGLSGIDDFLSPLRLPVAGAHGAKRRDAAGLVTLHSAETPSTVWAAAATLAARHPGLLLETKPSGFALHYRLNPSLAEECQAALAHALSQSPGASLTWELLLGHCVCELKQRGVSKGTAVQAFLAEPPFAGRVPVFIGDDVTDEDGFVAVQAAAGFGIHVGHGTTHAIHQLADTDAVASWLEAASDAGITQARPAPQEQEVRQP